jgi:hypothetical protein
MQLLGLVFGGFRGSRQQYTSYLKRRADKPTHADQSRAVARSLLLVARHWAPIRQCSPTPNKIQNHHHWHIFGAARAAVAAQYTF